MECQEEVRNDDETLINLVRSFSHIYDKRHGLFKDKTARTKAWLSIAFTLRKKPGDCEQRWIVLRHRYVTEKRKMRADPSIRKSLWPLFDTFEFLDTFITPRKSSWHSKSVDKVTLEDSLGSASMSPQAVMPLPLEDDSKLDVKPQIEEIQIKNEQVEYEMADAHSPVTVNVLPPTSAFVLVPTPAPVLVSTAASLFVTTPTSAPVLVPTPTSAPVLLPTTSPAPVLVSATAPVRPPVPAPIQEATAVPEAATTPNTLQTSVRPAPESHAEILETLQSPEVMFSSWKTKKGDDKLAASISAAIEQLKEYMKKVQNRQQETLDADFAFGKTVALHLKHIKNKRKKSNIKIQIMKVLLGSESDDENDADAMN